MRLLVFLIFLLSISTLNAQFSSTTTKKIDQIDNNSGVDIILNPVNSVKVNNFSSGFALQSGASQEIEESAVTNVELGYLSGVTSGIQSQIDGKQPTITGTDGDLYYWNSGLANLGIGLDGQVLQVSALGFPEWADLVAVSVTTKGDLQTYSTEPDRLAVGTDGQLLSANSATSTGLEWIDAPSTSPTTTIGDLIYNNTGTAAGDTRLPIGTEDQLLTVVSGEPAWADAPVSTTLSAKGEIQGHDGTNNIAIPSPTQDYQILTSVSAEDSGWKALDPILKDTALINSGFELDTTGWTITGDCTSSIVTDIPYLNKSLKLTCANQSFTVKQNVDLSAFVDQQALITAQVKANIGGMSVSSLTNDVASSTASVIAGDYKSINIPVKVGSTSNGVQFSASSVTGEFFIDEVGLRLAPDLSYQVGQAQFVGKAYFEDNDCDWITTSTSWGKPSTANDCQPSEIIGNISLASPVATPTLTVNNFRTDGYYKFNFQGLLIVDNNTGNCGYSISKDSNLSNNGKVYIEGANARTDNNVSGDIRFQNGDSGEINIIAIAPTGNPCSVRGEIIQNSSMTVHFYPDSNSTIVSQDTELTAATANELSARVSIGGSLSSQNYTWIDTCSETSTGIYVCNLVSDFNATEEMSCVASTDPNVRIVKAEHRQTDSPQTVRVNVTNDAGSLNSQGFNVICSKQGTDVNKNQTIIGKFEQIDSTPLCQVIAVDNDGENTNTNVTDIAFKTETKDNCNAWSNVGNSPNNNNDAYTAQKNSLIAVTINTATTSTTAVAIDVYEDGVQKQRCGVTPSGTTQKAAACIINAVKDSVYTFRFTNNFTLASTSVSHSIQITELPDTASIVENLNQNPRVSLQDQYSETEIKWGLWNGQQLYRRCFTVASDITSNNLTYLNFGSGLSPINSANYFSTLWIIDNSSIDLNNIARITYDSSTGNIRVETTNYKYGAGSSFCMDYTK